MTFQDYKYNSRVRQLKSMHNLMCEANDEELYMLWILYMPDCPSDEDFKDIARDEKFFNECWDVFIKCITDKDYL